MNIQEKIIALLEGDLKDDVQVHDLISRLSGSAELRHLLIEHIELGRQVDRFVGNIVPGTAARTALWSRIEAFENRSGASVPESGKPSAKWNSGKMKQWLWGGIVLALLAGVGIGYWLGEGKTGAANTSAQHSSGAKSLAPVTAPAVKRNNPAAIPESASGTSAKESVLSTLPASIGSGPVIREGRLQEASTAIKTQDVSPSRTELQMFSPNGGEKFKAGSIVPVLWSGELNDRLPTTLEYSTDGGQSWGEIGEARKGGRTMWQLPSDLAAPACLMRIVVEDTIGLEPTYARMFLGHDSGVGVAEISPDGKYLATVGSDTKVLLWDIRTGRLIREMVGHTNHVTFAKFSHDGKKFASCSQDGTVRVWDVETGRELHALPGKGQNKNLVWAVAFSPDDKVVVVTNDDGTLTLWDPESGLEFNPAGLGDTFAPHEESMRYIEFTPDGRYLIAASTDMTASIIDVNTGQVIRQFEHHTPDSLGENATREERREASRRHTVNGVQLTPDGKTLITCGYNGLVKFWDVETGSLIRSADYHNGAKVSSITLSSDGRLLVSCGYDGNAVIVDAASGEALTTIVSPFNGRTSAVIRASFSPDMRSLAVAHQDGRATLWRLKPVLHTDISDSFWSIEPCGVDEPKLD